jgi:hypothetical protein
MDAFPQNCGSNKRANLFSDMRSHLDTREINVTLKVMMLSPQTRGSLVIADDVELPISP